MTWVWLTLGSGFFNALWTSLIKETAKPEHAVPFTASLRWGVSLVLLPLAILTWKPVPPLWWLGTALAGLFECLSIWALTRGTARDYYSSFAVSNVSPVFVAMAAPLLLGETVGPVLWAGTLLVALGAVVLYSHGHWCWWGFQSAVWGALCGLSIKWVIGWGSAVAHPVVAFLIGSVLISLPRWKDPGVRAAFGISSLRRNLVLILASSAATVCFFNAVQMAPVTLVGPLVRVNLLFGFLFSYYRLKEKTGWKGKVFGTLFLAAGLALVLWNP